MTTYKLFNITGIRSITDFNGKGRLEPFKVVHFETKSGLEGEIRIKQADFQRDKVAELVRDAARNLEGVLAMSE
jgi:hypothetical protein|tara:strand:- start:515 stop:736 length:222 start_codon:yes stop_codon:yes gene_type:complete